jgi:hypothetical protein
MVIIPRHWVNQVPTRSVLVAQRSMPALTASQTP